MEFDNSVEGDQLEGDQLEGDQCDEDSSSQSSSSSVTTEHRSVLELQPNQCLNNKGAIGLKSTGNNFLDLFANNYKNLLNCNANSDSGLSDMDFKSLYTTCLNAMFENIDLYLKMIKYTRSIKFGKGEKVSYFLMIIILKMLCIELNEAELYKKILYWTHECRKDIMHIAKMQYSVSFLNYECELYSENVKSLIHSILSDQKLNSGDLLWLKYINTPHFSQISKMIWKLIPPFDINKYNPITNNGQQILKLLNTCNGKISNKIARQIKSYFHSELNLVDKIFQGYLPDGSTIECTTEHAEMISKLLEKCASLCNKKTIKTINKFDNRNDYHSTLVNGLTIYKNNINKNKSKIKVLSSSMSDECMDYYIKFENNKQFEDPILEAQLLKIAEEFKQDILSIIYDEKYTDNINIIIDQSGSMKGKPLNTALYMGLLLWEVLNIKCIYFFSNYLSILELPTMNGMCKKIEYLYRHATGSTNLQSVFDHLTSTQLDGKNHVNLIMTDCDCDPVNGYNNPFQIALDTLPLHQFCVCNVKETNITFPYRSTSNNVCYLTGNNFSILKHLIKCMVDSIKNNISINSNMLLECALNKFDTSDIELCSFKNRMDNLNKEEFVDKMNKLYSKIKKTMVSNVPPKNKFNK